MNISRITVPVAAFLILMNPIGSCAQQQRRVRGWEDLPRIMESITPPAFPDRSLSILAFGAVGDGSTDCTRAFRSAIDSCSAAGGGRVIAPAGRYLTGAIHLKSNVNLVVQKDAVVLFSTDPNDYLPVVYTRWEGVECMNYSPLIYAYEQSNIAVTGEGTLDGQGASNNWWSWNGKEIYGWKEGMPNQRAARKQLFEMAEQGIPVAQRVFGDGFYLRPNFFQPYKCTNILVQGVTFRDSPMWFLHPVLSRNISILNVTVVGLGPNNDGCDPESSSDILIQGCLFDTGDDCIAIKAGRNADGRRLAMPSENIVVRNCTMKDGHGGVVIGSEMTGGVRNVFAEDCRMDSPNLDRALRIKTNAVRGGVVENVFFRNVTIGQVKESILMINYYYEEGDKGSFLPTVRNVVMENVVSSRSEYGVWIKGFPNAQPSDIILRDCTFGNVEKGNLIENAKSVMFTNVRINGELTTK